VLHNRDRVACHDVVSIGNRDGLDARPGSAHVGDVDEAGVRLAERHLVQHRAHVRFLARRRHPQAGLGERFGGIRARRDRRRSERQGEIRGEKIVERVDVARITGRYDNGEAIGCEDARRPGQATGFGDLLHVRFVGRREHVRRGAFADLLHQRRRAGEIELRRRAGMRLLEGGADRLERFGQRGGGEDVECRR
jgi:hypothetical protein